MVSKFTDLECAPKPKNDLHDIIETYTIEQDYQFGGIVGNEMNQKSKEDSEQNLSSRSQSITSLSESAASQYIHPLKRRDSSFKYEDFKKDMYSRGNMFK